MAEGWPGPLELYGSLPSCRHVVASPAQCPLSITVLLGPIFSVSASPRLAGSSPGLKTSPRTGVNRQVLPTESLQAQASFSQVTPEIPESDKKWHFPGVFRVRIDQCLWGKRACETITPHQCWTEYPVTWPFQSSQWTLGSFFHSLLVCKPWGRREGSLAGERHLSGPLHLLTQPPLWAPRIG